MTVSLFDRYENAVAQLTEPLRQVALAFDVLDEDHFACADDTGFPVAGGKLHARVEVDDVLAARRRMPVQVVLGARLAKDDAGRGEAFGKLAAAPLLGPFDLDVAEMRDAVFVFVQVVD